MGQRRSDLEVKALGRGLLPASVPIHSRFLLGTARIKKSKNKNPTIFLPFVLCQRGERCLLLRAPPGASRGAEVVKFPTPFVLDITPPKKREKQQKGVGWGLATLWFLPSGHRRRDEGTQPGALCQIKPQTLRVSPATPLPRRALGSCCIPWSVWVQKRIFRGR